MMHQRLLRISLILSLLARMSSVVSLSWENHLPFAQCDYAIPSEVVSFYFRVICLALNVTVMAVVMLPQQEAII